MNDSGSAHRNIANCGEPEMALVALCVLGGDRSMRISTASVGPAEERPGMPPLHEMWEFEGDATALCRKWADFVAQCSEAADREAVGKMIAQVSASTDFRRDDLVMVTSRGTPAAVALLRGADVLHAYGTGPHGPQALAFAIARCCNVARIRGETEVFLRATDVAAAKEAAFLGFVAAASCEESKA